MTPQDILREAENHFAVIRAAIERKEINWTKIEAPEDGTSYSGALPGYLIIVLKGRDDQPNGAITTTGTFSVIHLTPEMAKVCFDAAINTQN